MRYCIGLVLPVLLLVFGFHAGEAAAQSEIEVTSSEGGALPDGGTDAQGKEPVGVSKLVTYTISNTGLTDLTLMTASASAASNVTIDSISAPGSTLVTPGGTTNFIVQYTPSAAGAFSFDLSFVNNDGNENPYNFTVSGTAPGPEIEVTSSEGGALPDGGTDAQGKEPVGVSKSVTYTISNTGGGDLTLMTASASAASNVTIDSISAPGSTLVTPGGTTNFIVQYTPSAAGAFSFDLSFVNNDGNENPYNFRVSGTAPGPEIEVTSSEGGALPDGGTDAQGKEPVGVSKSVTYTISNTGGGDLTLMTASASAASNVTIDSISAPGSTLVTPGGTTNFIVQYTPSAAGAFSFELSFTNNDGDENPYNFTVSGTAPAPEIEVSSSESGALVDGGTDAQGEEQSGMAKTVTYTVSNTGTDDLTIATATTSAASNVTINSVSAPGSASVSAGGSTTFTVNYTPTAAGAFSFELRFTNNDGDENPYNFTVSGTANTLAPEIEVSSSEGGAVASGGTDTQGNEPAGTAKTVTYTVSNTGTDDLTIAMATTSAASNVTINSVSSPGSASVSAGGSTTFTVNYTPTAAGAFSFELSFTNNDADENPYTFTVRGTTVAPEIAVSSSEGGSVASGGTDTQGNEPTGTAKTITYTVSNTGTDDLTIATATTSAASNVTIDSVSAPGSTTVSAGDSTTFTVGYTPDLAGPFSFELSIVNNDADENPYAFTVNGIATGATAASLRIVSGSDQSAEINTQFDDPLVVQVVDASDSGVEGVAVTFTAPVSGASAIFAASGTRTEIVTTGSDGTATSSIVTANGIASQYRGGGQSSYSVEASVTSLGSVSFSLTNERNAAADIRKTQEVIASFVTNRADLIVSNQPKLVSRLKRRSLGNQSGGNRLNLNATPNAQSGSFQFSLRAFEDANNQPGNSLRSGTTRQRSSGSAKGTPLPRLMGVASSATSPNGKVTSASIDANEQASASQSWQSDWDVWASGTFALSQSDNFDTHSGLFFLGVDHSYNSDMVVGLMAQLDIAEEDNSRENTSADGFGWMAGPYTVLRLNENFYFDGSVAYGRSYNSVNALGLFEDEFQTERYLLQGGPTGDMKVGDITTISPFARLTYYFEEQESYTDSLGRVIPSQDFDLGRLEFGPRISWNLASSGGMLLTSYLSVSGIYDFNKLQDTVPTDAILISADEDFRARLELGGSLIIPDSNTHISFNGFYDGIGVSGFESYGVTIILDMAF
ncbi:choice-of-anchor D domain-containing protein [Microbulbifer spongiae]|uniref:Choice-of-anchor D domain-containing protein n=1 Tax=Microbulbifer spongiae TaxID=2944933 RepID=A0ABY9EG97_9GAMM|nr:choice-of-anchor D domain-containing protein [Microbulbifer sp. MI-G]WKD50609.1 choice-of-anchor D domain-containing protein [Microbulbifer sp. MI-G]